MGPLCPVDEDVRYFVGEGSSCVVVVLGASWGALDSFADLGDFVSASFTHMCSLDVEENECIRSGSKELSLVVASGADDVSVGTYR